MGPKKPPQQGAGRLRLKAAAGMDPRGEEANIALAASGGAAKAGGRAATSAGGVLGGQAKVGVSQQEVAKTMSLGLVQVVLARLAQRR